MKRNRYGREIPEGESCTYRGETLCEDCYLDIRLGVKACGPWAVHSATRFRESSGLKGAEAMTGLQRTIYELVKSKGKLTREEVRESFGLPEPEMQRQLAILRYCELVRGHREDGEVS